MIDVLNSIQDQPIVYAHFVSEGQQIFERILKTKFTDAENFRNTVKSIVSSPGLDRPVWLRSFANFQLTADQQSLIDKIPDDKFFDVHGRGEGLSDRLLTAYTFSWPTWSQRMSN